MRNGTLHNPSPRLLGDVTFCFAGVLTTLVVSLSVLLAVPREGASTIVTGPLSANCTCLGDSLIGILLPRNIFFHNLRNPLLVVHDDFNDLFG